MISSCSGSDREREIKRQRYILLCTFDDSFHKNCKFILSDNSYSKMVTKEGENAEHSVYEPEEMQNEAKNSKLIDMKSSYLWSSNETEEL